METFEKARKALIEEHGWPANSWGTSIMTTLAAANLALIEQGRERLPYLVMLRRYALHIDCEPGVLRAQVDKAAKAGGRGESAATIYSLLSGGEDDESRVSSEQGD